MWGVIGCGEPAAVTHTDIHEKEAEKGDDQAKNAEAKTAGHNGLEHGRHETSKTHEHGVHDHKAHDHKAHDHKAHDHKAHDHKSHDQHKHGHLTGEPKDHKHGEHKHGETAPPGLVKVGGKVPDFSIRTLDGKNIKLSELQKDERRTKNGVVVLSYWCTTCHSCRDVEHLLAKLYKDYAGQAAVMAVDANANETAEDVVTFVKQNELELPVVLDPSGNTADLFGVNKTTTTVVIDSNGVLRYCGQFQHKGGGSAEEALKAVLAGKEVAVKATQQYG